MARRLYRSRTEKMLGGVCGGLGELLDIDPTIVRLVFVLLTIWGGAGALIYVILWLIAPYQDELKNP
jgi:phage shock protein PspC (stress-responsive transcriptional regulator)